MALVLAIRCERWIWDVVVAVRQIVHTLRVPDTMNDTRHYARDSRISFCAMLF